MPDIPLFAVVGHPNKGKSSVVAALTQDDSVVISPLSGTTRQSQRFRLELDGRPVFELVDTPGFQRADACLTWLRQQPDLNAGQRPARIRAFVDTFTGTDRFVDEVELLRPISEGASIVYVVDGSLPYSAEYETEMEILRWTAQPRLAIINPIEDDTFVDEWQRALSQYFSLVRIFDPIKAGFEQHLRLLRTFGELGNTGELDHAVQELDRYRQLQLRQASKMIVERLYHLLSFHINVSEGLLAKALPRAPVETFNHELNRIELESREALQHLFLHRHLHANMQRLQLLDSDLMDQEQWYLWGLGRSQLALISATAGATLGLGADLATGGHSLLMGSIGGGLLGGLSGWLGSDWLHQKLPDWLPYHQKHKQLGPVRDPNFGFVILGRALQHAKAMLSRSHADQHALQLDTPQANPMQQLSRKQQVQLLKWFLQLRKNGLQGAAAGHLEEWVLSQLY
jgi:hypothetical protein